MVQTKEQIQAQFDELQALRAENAALKNRRTIDNMKVSTKGAISFYGLGRFPVTLYASQWRKLVQAAKEGRIEDFIETHKASLAPEQNKALDKVEVADLNQQ